MAGTSPAMTNPICKLSDYVLAMAHAIKDKFKLALAQLNPVAGDIEGNVEKAREARARAAAEGADLIAFTELYLTGYPIEDLVLKPALQKAAREACEALARDTADGGPAMLIGLPWGEAPFVYNALALLDRGRIEAVRYKYNLPNYGVFDEKRVFAAGPLPQPIMFRGVKLGVPVCEDIWSEEACEALKLEGAELLIVPNGSPYWMDKQEVRYGVAETRVAETRLPLAYVNQVGGQDELVFDGASFVLNEDASLAVQLPAWEEALGITEWQREAGALALPAGPDRRDRGRRGRQLSRLRHGLARLCGEERLSGRGARAVGRRRLGALRGDGGRCAGGRARAWRDAALPLYQR